MKPCSAFVITAWRCGEGSRTDLRALHADRQRAQTGGWRIGVGAERGATRGRTTRRPHRGTQRGPGEGSEFTVWLPTARLNEGRARTRHPCGIVIRGRAVDARKVLIVDDREEVTRSLVRLLRAFGHETAVAHEGASALERATAFGPDCAIVDLGLPDMSGFELARRLREAFPANKLLLIAFTGSGGPRIDDECRAAGFDACVVKPETPRSLKGCSRLGRTNVPSHDANFPVRSSGCRTLISSRSSCSSTRALQPRPAPRSRRAAPRKWPSRAAHAARSNSIYKGVKRPRDSNRRRLYTPPQKRAAWARIADLGES